MTSTDPLNGFGDDKPRRRRQQQADSTPFQTIATQAACVSTRVTDTGGGFFIEEQVTSSLTDANIKPKHRTIPLRLPGTGESLSACNECHRQYVESYLSRHFHISVCDDCRKDDELAEKYKLMTKTTVKEEYLLTDNDLFSRQPSLKYISRENPHHVRWGKMQLFCRFQVEERALEVHGSETALEDSKAARQDKRDMGKRKKFDKKMKELRMTVRSSLYKKPKADHEHTFGEEWKKEKTEQQDEEDEEDVWCKKCTECGHIQEYEKM